MDQEVIIFLSISGVYNIITQQVSDNYYCDTHSSVCGARINGNLFYCFLLLGRPVTLSLALDNPVCYV